MTNTFTKLGVVFVLLGTVAVLGPAFGITSLTADRAVQVNAAETPATAYLGIDEIESKDDIYRDCIDTRSGSFCYRYQNSDIITLENNADTSFDDVTVKVKSVDGADNSILKVANNNDFSGLDSTDQPQSVELECGPGSGSADDTEVTLVIDGSGSTISVREATYTAEGIWFDCMDDGNSGDGPASEDPIPITDPTIDLELVDGSPESRSPDGLGRQVDSEVQFDITNGGSDVTITGISISEAGDADYLEKTARGWDPDGDEVQITGGGSDGSLNRDGRLLVGPEAQRYDLDEQATIESSENATVELKRFYEERQWSSEHDMSGKTVTLVLYTDLDHPDYQGKTPVEVTFSLPA